MYHINGETGRVGICRATKRGCPLGEGTPHFESKDEAKTYIEKEASEANNKFSTISKSNNNSNSGDGSKALSQRLTKETPTNIDAELSQLYNEHSKLLQKLNENERTIDYYSDRMSKDSDPYTLERFEEKIKNAKEQKDKLSIDARKLEEKINVYNAEFDGRGGWNRAFIVNNVNGHVHSSMNCSTCYADTEYNWVPEMSDKSEDEIVEAAGKKACTVCYPSAPVEVLQKPSSIMSEAEKIQSSERGVREAARNEKAKKAEAAAITAPDGKPLVYRDDYGDETLYKTERMAQVEAVDAMFDQLSYDVMKRNDKDNYWTDELVARSKARRDDKINILVEAIAAKRGITQEEVRREFEDKAQKKVKKWAKENNLQ